MPWERHPPRRRSRLGHCRRPRAVLVRVPSSRAPSPGLRARAPTVRREAQRPLRLLPAGRVDWMGPRARGRRGADWPASARNGAVLPVRGARDGGGAVAPRRRPPDGHQAGTAERVPLPSWIHIVAIEADDMESFVEGLTPAVEAAVPEAVAAIRSVLAGAPAPASAPA
ncbi:MAG: hypothetical protein MZV70_15905 [Desulfobacterales bacterium]|nr:hypothetical protein [Desulfobacterales bacterium]